MNAVKGSNRMKKERFHSTNKGNMKAITKGKNMGNKQ